MGHTHLPIIYQIEGEPLHLRLQVPEENAPLPLLARSLINPGSVGQPRDRDPRASFGIFDSAERTWEYRRVAYDVAGVQQRIIAAGLPERHAVRLSEGW